MLNARLAAAESMTHDVIRDLLGVKLDMANYAVRLYFHLLFEMLNLEVVHSYWRSKVLLLRTFTFLMPVIARQPTNTEDEGTRAM